MLEDYIAERMRRLLQERRWSPYRLIQESEASKTSVYNVLHGSHSIYVSNLNQMVEALGMDPHQFFDTEDVDYFHVTKEEKLYIERFRMLKEEKKERLLGFVDGYLSGGR